MAPSIAVLVTYESWLTTANTRLVLLLLPYIYMYVGDSKSGSEH